MKTITTTRLDGSQINIETTGRIREWSGLVLETRYEAGSAARKNRGRYAGTQIHRICAEYVVGLTADEVAKCGTTAAVFLKVGEPLLHAASPWCGCTQGQMAAKPDSRLSLSQVTCTKCLKAMAR